MRSIRRATGRSSVGDDDQERADDGFDDIAAPGEHPGSRGTPDGGGSVDPAYVDPVAEYDSGTEKTDPGDDIGGDSGRIGSSCAGEQVTE